MAASKRKNTVNWQDGRTLTKLMGTLAYELSSYLPYANPGMPLGEGHFGGDQGVMIAAINLRNRLDKLIKENPN